MEPSRHRFTAPRRVVTAPTTFQPSQREPSSQPGGLVETLYNHPNIKIISFTASAGSLQPRSLGRAAIPPVAEEPGSLSWSSQLERTIAVGAFRIYRAPGSVAFLSCGSALQPILPKSQAWCIDEASSKFVLQIRRPQYWRIEIPVVELEDQQRAYDLRGVLDQILQFEKTECPFTRTFTVELPERPQTPVKKRPWTPLRRSFVALPGSPEELSPTPKSAASERRASLFSQRVIEETEEPETSTTTESKQEHTADDAEESVVAVTPQEDILTETVDDHSYGEDVEAPTPNLEMLIPIASETRLEAEHHPTVSSIVKAIDAEYPAHIERHEDPIVTPLVEDDAEEHSSPETLQISEPSKEETISLEVLQIGEPSKEESPSPEIFQVSEPAEEELLPREELQISEPTNEERRESPEERGDSIMEASKQDLKEESSTEHTFEQKSQVQVAPFAPQPEEDLIVAQADVAPFTSSQPFIPDEPNKETERHHNDSPIFDESEQPEVDDQSGPYDVHEGSGIVGVRRRKLRSFRTGRSLTAPPQLTLAMSPPSKSSSIQLPPLSAPETEGTNGSSSPTGSSDSFHSVQSWHSPITPPPPSPPVSHPSSPSSTFPYPHDNIVIPKRASHHRDVSDLTVTPDTRRTWDVVSSRTDESSEESAITAPDAAYEVAEQPGKAVLSDDEATSTAVARRRPYGRHRATTSSISVGRRSLSPLPPAANLFSPPGPTRRQRRFPGPIETVRRIPMAIISKTCEVLLGPPSHLINLMLKVAARIAAGEWRGIILGFGESGEKIPVQWDYSDGEFSSWGDDDDYYMSNVSESARSSSVSNAKREEEEEEEAAEGSDNTGHSWGVD